MESFAVTLRFHDEIREPRAIGLPEARAPRRRLSLQFERAIDALSSKTVSEAELADRSTEALRDHRKREKPAATWCEPIRKPRLTNPIPKSTSICWQPSGEACVETENKFVARRQRSAASPHRKRAPKHAMTKARPQNQKPGKRAHRA